jgi:hypothetical protein
MGTKLQHSVFEESIVNALPSCEQSESEAEATEPFKIQ